MLNEISKIISVVFVWFVFLIIFFIRYRFPHFSMHFTNGISMFGIDNVDFHKKCKEHTKEDIERFKNQQKRILYFILILGTILITAYGISLFNH